MDDRGRLAGSLTQDAGTAPADDRASARASAPVRRARLRRVLRRCAAPILALRIPRGVGITATAAVILASASYGAVQGDHVAALVAWFKDARDSAANAAGFRLVSLALSGTRHVSRDEVLELAGITEHSSLVFLDVAEVRTRLKSNPWVADASVLKLYPGELQIAIKERNAYALWQKDGKVSVIAEDGTVVEPFVERALIRLPLVVGAGAAVRAKPFLDLLERYPAIEEQVRASILVGGRRWNLRLKNGLDVKLPEVEVAQALDQLLALDRKTKLISRDIVSIDLRLADRVTVRLSPAAAQVRADALKDKKPQPKKGERT